MTSSAYALKRALSAAREPLAPLDVAGAGVRFTTLTGLPSDSWTASALPAMQRADLSFRKTFAGNRGTGLTLHKSLSLNGLWEPGLVLNRFFQAIYGIQDCLLLDREIVLRRDHVWGAIGSAPHLWLECGARVFVTPNESETFNWTPEQIIKAFNAIQESLLLDGEWEREGVGQIIQNCVEILNWTLKQTIKAISAIQGLFLLKRGIGLIVDHVWGTIFVARDFLLLEMNRSL
ncbi:hypothetical protein N7493_004410 [Penicillium malachiteum]|uniref:Uncharacterized protein n=1 Tax=Penicillium malachiteum TaxID=1324776 RepID=A0AAD6HNI2_9EURO|nr:hypothetical protein N7493_004410 [Penicillium malachiteum]